MRKDKSKKLPGKPEWEPLLLHTKELHTKSTHPPRPPFAEPWEEIGPGYIYGPAFGHWDITHACFNTMYFAYDHAVTQMKNLISLQGTDGMLPGSIWMSSDMPKADEGISHPPVWPYAVEDLHGISGDTEIIKYFYEPLLGQIKWFEHERKADDGGFYYCDILNRQWESGIDESVRFNEVKSGAFSCVDATSHVYALYAFAEKWGERLGHETSGFREKAGVLQKFIQDRLFDDETGFFFDIWAVGNEQNRRLTFDGIWPMVVGAAGHAQAMRVIDENLLNPERFFTTHPISTVGIHDSAFELRMWRGPAWNSMTYWAARGSARYGRPDAAVQLLERALDESSRVFNETGLMWEFYHPFGGNPKELARKPQREYNHPCPSYLGHNPFYGMALMYDELRCLV